MTCPLPQQLQQLLDEAIPIEEQSALQTHLETCPACQQKVEQLAAGGVTWDKAAHNLSDKPNPAETALIDAVEKLQDAPTSAIHTQAEKVERPIDEDLSFLKPSQKANSIGRLDQYEILSVIGKGGFGIVLKGFDEELHRVVAIKVLLPHFAANGAARERFRREAKTAAAIMHENVVAIHAVSPKEARIPYLVMQFISGQTLADKIDKTGPLSVKEVLRIGMQIAEGLAAANKHEGMVHRDIKPANILLENGVERVKISDFGLARAADDASVTQSGTVAGTPMFMSPEQANGEPLDHRSDLFSLGSVLYVMCTGRPPFRAHSTMAVMKRVCEDSPTPVREVNADIPDWLADIITKLHAKKPTDRFQSAKEVAELLGQHLADVQAGRAAPRKLPVEAATALAPLKESVMQMPAVRTGGLSTVLRHSLMGWLTGAAGGLLFGCVATVVGYAANPDAVAREGFWRLGNFAILVGMAIGVLTGAFIGLVRWAFLPSKDIAQSANKPGARRLVPLAGVLTFASVGSALLVVFFGPPWDSTREKNHQAADDKPRFVPVFGGPDWRRLYDGKSYAGWKATGNSNAGRGEFVLFPGGAVDTLEKMPRNFHLRMEVNLFRGEGTVRFHAQPRVGDAGPTVGDEDWLLLFTESKSKVNCELLTRKVNQRMKLNSAGATGLAQVSEWTYVEIVAKDQYTDVLVNGVLCLTIQHIDNGPAAGVLSLWNTGRGDSQIAFRNIEIKDLTPPEDGAALVKAEKEKLQGVWQLVAEEHDGIAPAEPGPGLKGLRFHFKGDEFKTTVLDKPGINGSFSVNPGQKPAALDLTDASEGKKTLAIYRWDGDKLIICGSDEQRPTDFTTKVGDNRTVFVLESIIIGSSTSKPPEAAWVQLFNGKDLTGWVVTKFAQDVNPFLVLDQHHVLIAQPDGYMRTQKQYGSFILEFEFCTHQNFERNKGQHSGDLLLQMPRSDSMTGGYRIPIVPGNQAAVEGPKKESVGQIDWRKFTFGEASAWNQVRIESTAGNLEITLNGAQVFLRKDHQPAKGYLGIRGFGPGMRYRNIRIRELPPAESAAALLKQMQEQLLKTETVQTKFAGIWTGGSKFDGTFSISVKAKSLKARFTMEGQAPYTKSDAGDGVTGKSNRAFATIGYGGAFVPCFLLENFADDVKEQDPFFTDPRQMDASTPELGGITKVGAQEAQVVTFNLKSKNGLLTIQNRVWIDTKSILPLKWMTTATRGMRAIITTEEFENIEFSRPAPIAEKGVLDFAEIHDADDKRFDEWIAKMKKDGLRPVSLSVQAKQTRPRYTATAIRSTDNREWDFSRAFGDQQEVADQLKTFLSQRFKIAAHAAIIEEKMGLAVIWVRDDRIAFQDIWEGPEKRIAMKVSEGTKQGKRVLHCNAVVEAGQPNFVVTLIDANGTAWKDSLDVKRGPFQAWVEKHKDGNWRLDYFCAYGTGDKTQFAGVLIQDANGPDWDVSWGLTPAQYEAELVTRKNQGYRPQAVGHEDDTGAQRFSVIWIRYRPNP